MKNTIFAIRQKIEWLNERTVEYDNGTPTVSDKEWDKVYFELKELEDNSGIVFNDSPTQNISYQVVNSLEKVTHNHDMLSLDKTKDLQVVSSFLGNAPYIAMCKMDGLTCSLMYEDGQLVSAETRGNGQVGENILHNALVIPTIPKFIPNKERLVIDGEIICPLDVFDANYADEFKNSRNFAAGSIRLLDSSECAKRNLAFVAWEVIEGLEDKIYLSDKIDTIMDYGFLTVPYYTNHSNLTIEAIEEILTANAKGYCYPIDGLVFKFNDWKYGKSLGQTGHHAKNAIAYKFYDEEYDTRLLDIEWTIGRTGVLTPVAVFEPVDTGDSTIERASLHNLSVLKDILGNPYSLQPIKVAKMNMIIPQVVSAVKADPPSESAPPEFYGWLPLIKECPICGHPVVVQKETDSEVVCCGNPQCSGKLLNRIVHFCGNKGLDIKGISKMTIEKLLDWDWLHSIEDIFKLSTYHDEWVKQSGFGEKSVSKILDAIEASKDCELSAFIAALGIPLIGSSASKQLAKHFGTWTNFISAVGRGEDFTTLPDFGPEMHKAITDFDYEEAYRIADSYLRFADNNTTEGHSTQNLEGLTFVVTGGLNHFKNRNELKGLIEKAGGKMTGSISGKTSYLINNDSGSQSAKNIAASKVGVPIITEEQFIELFNIT